jgi:hypothetical protein
VSFLRQMGIDPLASIGQKLGACARRTHAPAAGGAQASHRGESHMSDADIRSAMAMIFNDSVDSGA